jgi:tetratricopeptide (TPR) repeat protein
MRSPSKQLSKRNRTGSLGEDASNLRLLSGQMMADIHRVMEGHEFASVEEANAFLAKLTGNGLRQALRDLPPASPREQAQQIAFDAMEARTERQARKLARQALALDPDCVDAIALLADLDARSPDEMIAGLEKAVQAGERSLGPAFFAENKGDFWGLLETRPYMSARMDLAQLLLSAGRTEEAIRHFEALLELNPNDNQGVRDVLLGCYLSRSNLGGAQHLLHGYREDTTAVFAWGRTLERFLSGDLPGAQRALRKARRENRFVEQYLTFQRPLPTDMPDTYALGSDEEAIICLAYLSGAWADHPLATSWLWEQLGFRQPSTPPQQNRLF